MKKTSNVRIIKNNLWKPNETSSRGKSTIKRILANYKDYYNPLVKNEAFYKGYYDNYFPHPQYLEIPNNYNSNSNITSIISNYYDLFGQKENLGFNLQTLSRLSWSDIGDYFTTLINEMGLGQNVSNISGSEW